VKDLQLIPSFCVFLKTVGITKIVRFSAKVDAFFHFKTFALQKFVSCR
jgi:hypothetical protein